MLVPRILEQIVEAFTVIPEERVSERTRPIPQEHLQLHAVEQNSWHSSPANDSLTRLDRAELRIAALEAATATTNGHLEVLASVLKALATAVEEDPAIHTDVAEMKWMVTSLRN